MPFCFPLPFSLFFSCDLIFWVVLDSSGNSVERSSPISPEKADVLFLCAIFLFPGRRYLLSDHVLSLKFMQMKHFEASYLRLEREMGSDHVLGPNWCALILLSFF